jgi:hypothetical protein
MPNLGRSLGLEPRTGESAAREHAVQQSAALRPPQPAFLQERPGRSPAVRLPSGSRSIDARSPASDDKAVHSEQEEWTSRDAYDYALKRSAGYATDEERVAVAIFYSLFADPTSCYAAMDDKGKERMRWCARAAIAALAERRTPSR